jgi:hypothetical protein
MTIYSGFMLWLIFNELFVIALTPSAYVEDRT